jgi:hypothetical protein
MAKNCPTRQPNHGAVQQLRLQGQQNFTYGKVNHVIVEEAQPKMWYWVCFLQTHTLQ